LEFQSVIKHFEWIQFREFQNSHRDSILQKAQKFYTKLTSAKKTSVRKRIEVRNVHTFARYTFESNSTRAFKSIVTF